MEEKNFTKNDNREADIIFSRTVLAGKRIYYMDVKKNRKGELFLALTESKKIVQDESTQTVFFEKHKIFLYKEDFDKFTTALEETLAYIKENNTVDYVPTAAKENEVKEEFEPIHFKIDF
ncbi:DNA-binding protein [Bacteroidia bacterium]|nr:DNA-binding protein [Bacteroidia bacterium]